MITKEEYLKSLDIVGKYHKQLNLQITSKCDKDIVEEKFELIEGLGKIISSSTVATITTKHYEEEDLTGMWLKK